MQFQRAPLHMYGLRNQTVTDFGYDNTNTVNYSFNSLGYRGTEFVDKNPIILLGGSITFGIGLDKENTFGGIVEQRLNVPVYNFAWGCYGHTNHEQLTLLENILDNITPLCVIWQINNLNRKRVDEKNCSFNNDTEFVIDAYNDFYKKSDNLLKTIPHILLHWDEEDYGFDFSHCLIYNKYNVDSTSIPKTFGIRTNQLIAEKILAGISQLKIELKQK